MSNMVHLPNISHIAPNMSTLNQIDNHNNNDIHQRSIGSKSNEDTYNHQDNDHNDHESDVNKFSFNSFKYTSINQCTWH